MGKRFTVMAVIMSVCLIASNIFETKIFSAGPLTLTGGFLVFPVSYILGDCMTEIFGYKNTRFAIILSFAMNALFVLTAQLVRILPPETYWDGQAHFAYIFNADLRITLASLFAFLFGSLLNSKIMAKMRENDGERRFGWRAVLSSLAGESLDSLIFFPIAFWGIGLRNIVTLMVTQIVLKTLYEVIVLPVTVRVVRRMKSGN